MRRPSGVQLHIGESLVPIAAMDFWAGRHRAALYADPSDAAAE
jgi:hypothetical protein